MLQLSIRLDFNILDIFRVGPSRTGVIPFDCYCRAAGLSSQQHRILFLAGLRILIRDYPVALGRTGRLSRRSSIDRCVRESIS